MTYFENMVKDSDCFALDLIFDAREILKKALELEIRSTELFCISREADEDRESMYWQMSCECSQRAHGLLDAYKIFTNREIVCTKYAIEDEIDWIEWTFNEIDLS